MRLVSFRTGDEVQVGSLEDDRVRVLAAPTMVDWLAGEGRLETRVEHGLEDVELLAPIPEPPSVRDFFAFEEHVKTGMKLRGGEVPEAWYEAPTFYFTNPAAVVGPDAEVRRPPDSRMLDFELELAAVIGPEQEIAAFTLLNDWSARDLQAREMTVGLGPAKGKDFAISLGPWLLTADELPLADGRARRRGHGDGQRRAAHEDVGRRAALPLAATSWPTPRATRGCAPATCSARAR